MYQNAGAWSPAFLLSFEDWFGRVRAMQFLLSFPTDNAHECWCYFNNRLCLITHQRGRTDVRRRDAQPTGSYDTYRGTMDELATQFEQRGFCAVDVALCLLVFDRCSVD